MKQSKILKVFGGSFSLLLIAFILPFIFSSVLLPVFVLNENLLINTSIQYWILIYMGLSLCMSLACIHTTSVSLLSGYFLGWLSLPFLILSYALASIIGYWIARKVDKGKLLSKLMELKGANEVANDLKKNEFMVIFFCRLSPVLPFAVINLLLSLLQSGTKNFLIAGTLGMLPRSILFLFIGIQARSIREAFSQPSGNYIIQIFVLIMLIISALGLFYYLLRAFRRKSKVS